MTDDEPFRTSAAPFAYIGDVDPWDRDIIPFGRYAGMQHSWDHAPGDITGPLARRFWSYGSPIIRIQHLHPTFDPPFAAKLMWPRWWQPAVWRLIYGNRLWIVMDVRLEGDDESRTIHVRARSVWRRRR